MVSAKLIFLKSHRFAKHLLDVFNPTHTKFGYKTKLITSIPGVMQQSDSGSMSWDVG